MSIIEDILHAMKLQESQQYAQAEFFFKKALMNPQCPTEAYIGLGVTYEKMDRTDDAMEAYKKAISLKKDLYEAHGNLANLYRSRNNIDLAIEHYQQAIALAPKEFPIGNALSSLLNEQKRYEEALTLLLSYYHKPCSEFVLLNNIGFTYLKLKQYKKALKFFSKAIKISHNDDIYNNIANAYTMIENYKKAQYYALKALELNENNIHAYVNLATTYEKNNEIDKAIELYEYALQLDPNANSARYNLGFMYLLLKKYKKGFQFYEARLDKDDFKKYTHIAPMWQGENLKNKTLLIHKEQGFGDSIQALRYLKPLSKQSIPYSLLIHESFERLIRYNFPNIEVNHSLDTINYTLPIMSIPYRFNFFKPKPLDAYLDVNPNDTTHYAQQLDKTKLNIGLVWKGSMAIMHDKRYMELELFKPLMENMNIQFYSLQIEHKEELTHYTNNQICDWGEGFNDFYDTACAIKTLDLVISIDTAVAHLSGALGVPTFLLLPYHPDWRWGLGSHKNDWYKSLTLFRQTKSQKWKKTVKKISKEISKIEKK